jgi:hypothetical protein
LAPATPTRCRDSRLGPPDRTHAFGAGRPARILESPRALFLG